MKHTERGWYRVAFQKIKCPAGRSFVVQATIWRDKKVVGFLHNHQVVLEADDTVLRYSPTKKQKKEIRSHPVTQDYIDHYNGVDRKDRDTADWSTTLRSNRFYLRIVYWLLDSVMHAMFCIVKDIVKHDPEHPWKRYLNCNNGRYRFQMDLAISLINHGLSLDWKDPKIKNEPPDCPSYVRKKDWYPCGCLDKEGGQVRCFFCMNGLTHGIGHRDVCAKRPTPSKARKQCSERVDLGTTAPYCRYCIDEVKAENNGVTVKQARKLAAAKAKTTNTKASTRKGCKTCNVHVCERHWEDHGRNN